jgi:5-carboxymethyl-2-hydroxymuconate isomerase
MPYLKIDYTDNLLDFPAPVILAKVNKLLAESEAIRDEFDLKSSVSALSNYKIGTQEETRAFVYARFHLFPGRSSEIRKDLANRIASVLRRHVPRPAGVRILVSVEMIEMNRDTYRVETLEG